MVVLLALIAACAALSLSLSLATPSLAHCTSRTAFVSTGISSFGSLLSIPRRPPSSGVASATTTTTVVDNDKSIQPTPRNTVIYQPLSIDIDGVRIPIAAWYPSNNENSSDSKEDCATAVTNDVSYEYRISVSKIGKYLAQWNLPTFFDRNFKLLPSMTNGAVVVVQSIPSNDKNGDSLQQLQLLPQSSYPMVLLAHGFLGSRFDLSHLGETLASNGFLVLSPEYPESLSSSYDISQSTAFTGRRDSTDRTLITNTLLTTLTTKWGIVPASYGIVGHSLGCGTVDTTGDEHWTRVCIAGFPSLRGSNCLFIGSINDGAVPALRSVETLKENNFVFLNTNEEEKQQLWNSDMTTLPSRAALIFRNINTAPNHISFLAEGPNNAMVEFLSPLLPLARLVGIPLLDFDKYQLSRDSKVTSDVVIPLIVEYMKQNMIPRLSSLS